MLLINTLIIALIVQVRYNCIRRLFDKYLRQECLFTAYVTAGDFEMSFSIEGRTLGANVAHWRVTCSKRNDSRINARKQDEQKRSDIQTDIRPMFYA